MRNRALFLVAALMCGTPVLWGVESHQAQSPAQLPAGLTLRTQSAGPIPSGSPGRDSLTEGYRREALGLIIREANRAAKVLQLPERLPICESNVVESFLSPLRYAQETGAIGTISTTNYCYCFPTGRVLANGPRLDMVHTGRPR